MDSDDQPNKPPAIKGLRIEPSVEFADTFKSSKPKQKPSAGELSPNPTPTIIGPPARADNLIMPDPIDFDTEQTPAIPLADTPTFSPSAPPPVTTTPARNSTHISNSSNAASSPLSKLSKKGLIIGIIAAVTLLVVGGGIAIFLLFIILLSRTAGDTNLANTSQENTTDYPRESDFNPDLFIPSPDTPTSQDQIPPHINTPPSTSEELIEAIEARRPINCQAPIAGGSIRSRIQANDGHSRARITTNYIQGIGLILGNVDILVTPDRLYLWGNGGAWHWAHDGDVSIWELVDVVASSDDGRVVCDLVNPNNFNPPRHINFVESWLTLDEFLQR